MPRVARVSLAAQHEGDYMAAGSYNQPIDVHPGTHTVVAHQGVGRDITMEYLDMHRAFMAFRQIGHHLANRGWGWTGLPTTRYWSLRIRRALLMLQSRACRGAVLTATSLMTPRRGPRLATRNGSEMPTTEMFSPDSV
jgi:hypothetical protein